MSQRDAVRGADAGPEATAVDQSADAEVDPPDVVPEGVVNGAPGPALRARDRRTLIHVGGGESRSIGVTLPPGAREAERLADRAEQGSDAGPVVSVGREGEATVVRLVFEPEVDRDLSHLRRSVHRLHAQAGGSFAVTLPRDTVRSASVGQGDRVSVDYDAAEHVVHVRLPRDD
jgi:hypothetical protein